MLINIYMMTLTVILGLSLLFAFRKQSEPLKLLVVITVFSIARVFFGFAWKSVTGNVGRIEPSEGFYTLLLANFCILSLLFLLTVNLLMQKTWKSLGWINLRMTRKILIGIAVGAAFFLILTFNKKVKIENWSPAISFSFLIASWQEENIFRGHLILYLSRRYDTLESVVYQALIYSIAHIGFYPFYSLIELVASLVFAFILGLIFGYMRIATKNQIPAFLAHGIIDTAFLMV